MRIVYMGTPRFAVPALERLVECGRHEVVTAVTQPDRPRGRNLQLAACPVKEAAVARGVAVLTPERIGDALAELTALRPDVIAVAAYGQFIPRAVRELAPKGCINIHPSLLPKYRGAAPIQWAVANGDAETGVTIMHVAKVMDSGDIILQRPHPIPADASAADLEPVLAQVGADMLLEAIDQLGAGTAARIAQDEAQVTIARKLTKEDGRLDWTRPAVELANRVRGFQPWPGCHFTAGSLTVKVHKVQVVDAHGQPGCVLDEGPTVACGTGALRLLDVQPEGKRAMPATDWMRGARIATGAVLA